MESSPAVSGQPAQGSTLKRYASRLVDLRILGLITVFATYGLIVLGGVVRATDSGTACPDWPLCHGQVIPPAETKVLIEFSHRLVASLVGFMILGMVLQVWRLYRHRAAMKWAAVATVFLLALQVIVGGITVGTETAAGVVAIHLSIALMLISLLIFIVASAWTEERPSLSSLAPVSVLGLAGVYVVIILGAFVSQTDAGLAYPDWPLFDGRLVPADSQAGILHYVHRVVADRLGTGRGLRRIRCSVALWRGQHLARSGDMGAHRSPGAGVCRVGHASVICCMGDHSPAARLRRFRTWLVRRQRREVLRATRARLWPLICG